MYPILVDSLCDDPADSWEDAEEQLHSLARWHALQAARAGQERCGGRGAVIVPWPPEERLVVDFLPESACAPLGPDVQRRVATYDPRAEFVMVYLSSTGGTGSGNSDVDAYTYRIPPQAFADEAGGTGGSKIFN